MTTNGFENMAAACKIMRKYNPYNNAFRIENDELMAEVDPDKLSREDRESLESLGWFEHEEYGCMFLETYGA